jgi:hypothetical protein
MKYVYSGEGRERWLWTGRKGRDSGRGSSSVFVHMYTDQSISKSAK